VADGIRIATGLVPDLKWPNDVFVSGRKVAGVLAEATSSTAGTYVVLGFGINVSPAAYPPEVAARATSLERELGRAVDRGLLLAECLCSLAERYHDLLSGRRDAVVEAWRVRAAATAGRLVQWDEAGGAREGVADSIDDTGALVVRTNTGLARVMSGEVRWV
jgi:BirA family biotin operon repressor/biotin-[acetyl-CoA-carboxylase] ligase